MIPPRLSPHWFVVAILSLLCVASCREAPDPGPGEARDPVLATPFVIQSEVTIGGDAATGPMALGGIRTARLVGSSVLVPEVMIQEIRVFDLSGEYVETFGRRGAGPGEYEALGAVFGLPGEGVVGWDRGRRTATLHGATGIETVALFQGQFPDRTPQFLGVLRDTTFVVGLPREALGLRGFPPGPFTDTVPFLRVDRRGLIVDTIAMIEAPEREVFDVGPMWGVERYILGDELRAVVTGEQLVIVTGREVRRYSASGASLVHEWPTPSPAITSDLVRAERERRISQLGTSRVLVDGQSVAKLHRDVIRDLPVTEDPLPAFDDIRVGEGGAVWVRAFTMPSDTISTWFLIDADGRTRGYLELPIDERIESGTSEHVIVRSRDTLGSTVLKILELGG